MFLDTIESIWWIWAYLQTSIKSDIIMNTVLQIAFKELGAKEIKGQNHNQRIVDYAKGAGIKGIDDDETPWCSIFANWVCKKAKKEMSHKANARSWVNVGYKTNSPQPGDVVVFWHESPTSWKGHVAFFLGYSADLSQVYSIGGNQGNAVSVAAYDAAKVMQFRRISEANVSSLPSQY